VVPRGAVGKGKMAHEHFGHWVMMWGKKRKGRDKSQRLSG
jgi:hypothetical protein